MAVKSIDGFFREHVFPRAEINNESMEAFIGRHRDKDVYFCAHGFTQKMRRKVCAVPPLLLYADLDEVDPHGLKLRPTYAIQSSPGRYVGLWRTDRPVTEALNRDLTMHIGADPSGWDFSQVLRVPGTRNYKYKSHPRVRLLWSDGPTYRVDDLRRQIPATKNQKEDETKDDALRVFEKYEEDLSRDFRRDIFNERITQGKRSDVIYSMHHECNRVGMTVDETVTLLWASPWNKYRERHDGMDQLRREVVKVRKSKMNGHTTGVVLYQYLATPMSDVEMREIDWLWYPYLARGEVTIMQGDPNIGKSYLCQMVALAVCDGKKLPSVRAMRMRQGHVAYFDAENSPATVTKKRLLTNGCEHMENFYQEEEPFSLDDEVRLVRVYEAIERIRPVLVVFDTLNAYVGKTDTGKATDTTQVMARFKDIAVRFHCAVVVLRHLTKGSKEKAIYRGQGNIAITGSARIELTVGTDPDDQDVKVLSITKLNITERCRAITFSIQKLPDTLRYSDRSRFVWGDYINVSPEETLQQTSKKAGDAAKAFLTEELAGGPMELQRLITMAEQRGISQRTLYRTGGELGVRVTKSGFGGSKASIWELKS